MIKNMNREPRNGLNRRVRQAKTALATYGNKNRKGFNVIKKRQEEMRKKYPQVFAW
jgi:hypothetical protein